jgi:hypothetical protein
MLPCFHVGAKVEPARFGPQAQEFVQTSKRRRRNKRMVAAFLDTRAQNTGDKICDECLLVHLAQNVYGEASVGLVSFLVLVHGKRELQDIRIHQQASCNPRQQ